MKKEEYLVLKIEKDPNRSAKIALIQSNITKNIKYIIAPDNIKENDIINNNNNTKKIGNHMKLKDLPIGTHVYNVETKPFKGGQLSRSAGTFCQLLQLKKKYAKIKLPSKEEKLILNNCKAIIGRVSNINKNKIKLFKAGQKRWLGIKPTVRGVAMNPVDHPHGGGEGKSSGGRPSVTPWGKLTKGKKTVIKKNKFIIKKKNA